MGLKLSLKPGEKFVVNGAVLVNADRRASLVIENRASVLRERDIMQPDDANTPAKRLYFVIMLMYLDESERKKLQETFVKLLSDFMGAVSGREAIDACLAISAHVSSGDFYKALAKCRRLFDYERERLEYVA